MSAQKLPLAIEIEINSDCNLTCSYCPNSKARRIETGHMPVELFEKIMIQLSEANYVGRISYHFYNEPTLSPNLALFVKMTRKYLSESRIVIYTNGLLLTDQKIQDFENMGVNQFIITEHIKTKLSDLNIENYTTKEHTQTRVKFDTYKNINFSNRGGLLQVGEKISQPLTTPCFIPHSVMVLTVKGNVVACYEDFFQKHNMGNINEKNIVDIWNSEKYVDFRNDLKSGYREKYDVCKKCNNKNIFV